MNEMAERNTTPTRSLELMALARVSKGGLRTSDVITPIADHDWLMLVCDYDEDAASERDAIRVIAEYNDGRSGWQEWQDFSWRGGTPGATLIRAMGSANPAISGTIPLELRNYDLRFRLDGKEGALTRLRLTTDLRNIKIQPFVPPASVSHDSTGSTNFANVSSASYSHTFVSPSGVAVFVLTGQFPAGTSTVSSLTVGGNATVNEGTVGIDTANNVRMRSTAFTQASPGTGGKTVACTFAAGGHYGVVGSVGVTGGDTSDVADGFNSAASASTSNPSVAITSATGDLVLDGVGIYNSNGDITLTVGADQTERVNSKNAGSNTRGGVSSEPGASSVTMSWTRGGGTSNPGWVQTAINMRAAAAAGNPWYYYQHQ